MNSENGMKKNIKKQMKNQKKKEDLTTMKQQMSWERQYQNNIRNIEI